MSPSLGRLYPLLYLVWASPLTQIPGGLQFRPYQIIKYSQYLVKLPPCWGSVPAREVEAVKLP